MFHVQMEIHSFNSDLDLKKSLSVSIAPRIAEPSSNGEKKLIDRALEEKRKGFKRSATAYLYHFLTVFLSEPFIYFIHMGYWIIQ